MSIFAFSCGLRRVTLRCPYDSTASYDLRSLYDFVVVCTFTNFKNRKTVARRHVVGRIIVRAPYERPAMIVRSPHGFMMTARNRKDSSRPLHGLRRISTLSVRRPFDFTMISKQFRLRTSKKARTRNRTMPV